jgi:hypothetical protein
LFTFKIPQDLSPVKGHLPLGLKTLTGLACPSEEEEGTWAENKEGNAMEGDGHEIWLL